VAGMGWVGLGGMVGAVLRYVVSSEMDGLELWVINGIGSLFLGFLTGRIDGDSKWKLFLGTGMIGSFTTFSAFSEEWFAWLEHDGVLGVLYGVGMTTLCFILCWVGLKAGKIGRVRV